MFGADLEGFLVVGDGGVDEVLVLAVLAHDDVFGGEASEEFLLVGALFIELCHLVAQGYYLVEFMLQESARRGFLDVVAGMYGDEEMVEAFLYVSLFEALTCGMILGIGFRLGEGS